MTEQNIEAAVIKRTQESLGKYVKKPPLTEKLLKKPPFRFLHDIFNVVIKDTGCFAGLYTPAELNVENIKDREDKMKFMQKMIDVIKLSTGNALTVRTSKIVAGQEPEKTNELLQLMAEVIEKKLDWQTAVDKVNSGKTVEKGKEVTKTKDRAQDKPQQSKSKDKPKDLVKEKEQHSKETKAKDAKSNSKRISPTDKDDKPSSRKATVSKEKEKIAVKATATAKNKTDTEDHKEKVSSKRKEAAEKEKSTSKTKTEVKKKSPSPNKVDDKLDSKLPLKVTTVKDEKVQLVKGNAEMETAEEKTVTLTKEPEVEPERRTKLKEPITTPTKEPKIESERRTKAKEATTTPTKEPEIELEPRRNGKRAEEVPPSLENGEEKAPISAEIGTEQRKSSAKRKVSSGKSRRSSAHKVGKEEQEQQQHSLQTASNSESLKTVSEERESAKQLDVEPTAHQKPHNNNNEVKRESTFTRDELKEITNVVSDNNNNNNVSKSNKHTSNDTANNARPRTSLRPPSARPASARPGAPRRRDKNVEIVLQPNDQLKLSNINVKLETFGDFGDNDGENLVIIEDANVTLNGADDIMQSTANSTTINGDDNSEQQGHLVQQILETQKELVQQNGDIISQLEKKDAKELAGGTRQSSARQMNNLRDVIQNLTKSVNPFGKLMDFIPEDIDAMQLEMSMWRESFTQAANELKRERSLTESTTEPMKMQLVQIEANIKEYFEMVDASRTKILQNSDKILKMLMEQ